MNPRDLDTNSEDFERELARALREEAYGPPLRLDAGSLHQRLAATRRPMLAARSWRAMAAALALATVVVLLLAAPPSRPGPSGPGPTDGCPVSVVTRHGSWWKEIGGEQAFFNAEPDAYRFSAHPWLMTVRFDPDATSGQRVAMWAERIETGERVTGQFNSRQDPANIYRYDDPAPRLPGGWYLFEQRLPVPGCWRLSAAIDGRVVGTALIEVGGGARPPAAGTYMTARTIEGHPCFAFAITASRYERATDLPAWWWDESADGSCPRRPDDAATIGATILPLGESRYELVLRLPSRGDGSGEIRIVLDPGEGGLAGIVSSAGNRSVFFTRLFLVEPSSTPGN